MTSETSSASYGVRKATDPSVCPGVWSTTKSRPANDTVTPSASSSTRSGSTNVSR